MTRELFVKCVEAIQKQMLHDSRIAVNMSFVFPDVDVELLKQDNHHLSNALLEVLQTTMNDLKPVCNKMSWLEYFCFEADFGNNPTFLRDLETNKNHLFKDAGSLYDMLHDKMVADSNKIY